MVLEQAEPDVGCTAKGFLAIQVQVFRFQPLYFFLLTPET